MVCGSWDYYLKNDDAEERYLYNVAGICFDISGACLLRNSLHLLYIGRELIVFYTLCSC